MFEKFKIWLIYTLQNFLYSLLASYNTKEESNREEIFRNFFHEVFPTEILPNSNIVIIEKGKFSYFVLPSGDLPQYDFVIPNIPLYVCTPGLVSASWKIAQSRGITRDQWEIAQADLVTIENNTRALNALNPKVKPILVVIRWEDPISKEALTKRFKDALR